MAGGATHRGVPLPWPTRLANRRCNRTGSSLSPLSCWRLLPLFKAAGTRCRHRQSCRRLLPSSAKLPVKPAGHRSSSDLPALVITLGNCRCRSGRARTVRSRGRHVRTGRRTLTELPTHHWQGALEGPTNQNRVLNNVSKHSPEEDIAITQ